MRLVLIVGLLVTSAATARAASLKIGDRLRVTTIANATSVGRLAHADSSRLVLTISEQTRMAPAIEQAVPRRSIALIERSDGLDSKTGKGALIGGGVGALTGVIVGFLAAMSAENSRPIYYIPPTFAVTGALIGAGAGSAASREHWTEVPADAEFGSRPDTVGSTPRAMRVTHASPRQSARASHGVLVGDRIRLTTASMPSWPIVGRVTAANDSQLTIAAVRTGDEDYGREHTFDWDAIERVDRSTGWQSGAGKGAVSGAGVGVLLGAAQFAAAVYGVPSPFVAPPVESCFLYGVVGAFMGGSIGASKRTESWTPAFVASGASLSPGSDHDPCSLVGWSTMPLDPRVSQSPAMHALENAQLGVTIGRDHVPMLAIRTTF